MSDYGESGLDRTSTQDYLCGILRSKCVRILKLTGNFWEFKSIVSSNNRKKLSNLSDPCSRLRGCTVVNQPRISRTTKGFPVPGVTRYWGWNRLPE